MKYILSSLLVFTLAMGVSHSSFAESEDASTKVEKTEKTEKADKKERRSAKGKKSYSRMLNRLVLKAAETTKDEEQKEKLLELRNNVVFPLVKKENAVGKQKSDILRSLSSPDFDQAAVMKQYKKVQSEEADIFGDYVKGLTQLKSIVGDGEYNKLFTGRKEKMKKQKAGDEKKAEEKESDKAAE